MSSVDHVPEYQRTGRPPLTAADAWTTIRRIGARQVTRDSLHRFRYGDGFSHARALGFQVALAAVPLVIAGIGLAAALETPSVRLVLRQTILHVTPGASDALVRETLPESARSTDPSVPVLGLLFAVVALTTAMGQLERGANRIYGIQRDRPTRLKYARAALMAGGAGLPVLLGSVVLMTVSGFAEAVEGVYGVPDDLVTLLTWPVGLCLVVGALTTMLRFGPARRQPSWGFLFAGALLALVSWTALTLLLAGFLALSSGLGSVYGPLTGVMALLVWAQLTSGAVFLGLAFSAELELKALPGASAVPVDGAPADTGVAA